APGIALALFLSAYVVLMPNVNVLPEQEPYNTKRIFELILLAGSSLGLVFLSSWRAAWIAAFLALPRMARWTLGLLLLGGVVSAALAPRVRFALLEVGHLTLLFLLVVLIAAGVREHPRRAAQIITGVLVLSAGFYLLGFAVVHAVNLITLGDRLWPHVSHIGFSHIRFFDQYQAWTLPLIPLAVFLVPRSWKVIQALAVVLLAGW